MFEAEGEITMKKIKIVLTLLSMIICTSMFAACSNTKTPETTDNVNPATTTKEVETTTPKPTTTEEVTTEAPYKKRGTFICIPLEKKDQFNGLIVEKGDIIYINDLVADDAEDWERGNVAEEIIREIYYQFSKYDHAADAFYEAYYEPGADILKISREQNAYIEYVGEEKICFHFVKESEGRACFDVYVID